MSEGEQLRVSFSDSDGESASRFTDELSSGFVSEYGSSTHATHTSTVIEPDFQEGMHF
jgi:hypothetical protein